MAAVEDLPSAASAAEGDALAQDFDKKVAIKASLLEKFDELVAKDVDNQV